MELQQLKPGARFKCVPPVRTPPGHADISPNQIILFHHIDGMYSYCETSNGQIVHPCAWQEVILVEEEGKAVKTTRV